MSHQQKVNPLGEGIFLALITALMGALAIYFLPIKFLVDYIWGIPIIIIIKRYNLQVGILTLITTFFFTWLFTTPVETLLLFIMLAPLALIYGFLFKQEISSGTILLSGAAVSVLSTILAVIILLYIAPQSVIPTEQALRDQAEHSMSLYNKLGLVNANEAKMYAETSVRLMSTLIPAAFAIGSIIRAFFTYILAIKVLQKLNYRVARLPLFSEWRLPWYSVWLLIAGLGMSLIGDQCKLTTVAIIGKNIVFIVFPLFFVIGLAVVTHFFKIWKIAAWIKVLLGIAAVANIIGSLVLFTLIGIFDPLVSFRRWKRPEV